MDDQSAADDYLEFLVRRKFAPSEDWTDVPIETKLRNLQKLNSEVLKAYKRREANGGKAIPVGWRPWPRAQEVIKK